MIAPGCEIIEVKDVSLTVYVQVNNFSDSNVFFWTTVKRTQTLVSQNEQYARQEGTMEVTPGKNYSETLYLKKEGSSNDIDAQVVYYVNADNSSNTELTIIFTWDGTNLTQE